MKPMVMAFSDAEFDAAEMTAWTQMASRILKGAAPDSLDRHDEDGLVTKLLYPVMAPDMIPDMTSGMTPDMTPGMAGPKTMPGYLLPAFPHERLANGWHVCQPLAADADGGAVQEALSSGATALVIQNAAPDEIVDLLDGVVLSAIGIGFDGKASTVPHYYKLLTLAGGATDQLDIDLGLDVLTQLDEGLALHRDADAAHRLFRVDGWAQHNLGLTAAQELGFILSGLASLLRMAAADGVAPGNIAGRVSARLALPADMFSGIVKIRAMRQVWDGLLAACGVEAMPLRLEGYASLRMMSVLDDEVNMLRTTTALLGGAIGGADVMVGFGHDLLTGESAAARRTARLAQVMMMAESGLSANLDPAAGAPFIESRTGDLADAGWQAFQEIERAGGLAAAMADGMIAEQAATAAGLRDERLCKGDDDILGVTLQPTGGSPPEVLPEFDDTRRPAALVEALRRKAAASQPRILILLGATDNAASEERDIRRWLGIAGLQALTVKAGSGSPLADARPDIVIGCGVTALPDGATAASFRSAAECLGAGDRIAGLETLLTGRGDAS